MLIVVYSTQQKNLRCTTTITHEAAPNQKSCERASQFIPFSPSGCHYSASVRKLQRLIKYLAWDVGVQQSRPAACSRRQKNLNPVSMNAGRRTENPPPPAEGKKRKEKRSNRKSNNRLTAERKKKEKKREREQQRHNNKRRQRKERKAQNKNKRATSKQKQERKRKRRKREKESCGVGGGPWREEATYANVSMCSCVVSHRMLMTACQ